jgi:hypothetical protein
MSIPYFDKGSSSPGLPMNQPATAPQPVAWRSREIGPDGPHAWRVHTADPTENLKRYASFEFEVEPLYARS